MSDWAGKTNRREREDIQQELLEQERLEILARREQTELEMRFLRKLEMIQGLDNQVKEHQLKRTEIANEDTYYKNMLQKNAEENAKLDILTSDKRRIKKMQLRKELQELISERRRKHAENMQILLKLHEQEQEELAERKRKIEKERIRMLREHAEHLIGYMPTGILREDDLPLLGTAVYDKYKPKKTS